MALSKTENSKSYVATGLTTFEFNIPYFSSSDLVVKRQNADGTVTTLSQTASPANAEQYSVTASGNNTENGATITLGGASTVGLTYTIERIVPYTQQYDLQEGATIDPTALNKALDRTVAQNQQQQSVFDRTLVFPITDASTITYDVGTVTQRSGKALGFDTSGNVTQIDINSSGTFAVENGSALTLTEGGILSTNVDDTTVQITGNNIAVKTVGTGQLATDAVTSGKISAGSVIEAKIADAAVTEAKLASNSVTSNKISGGSIITAKLGDDSVTNAKIASNAVGTTEIADDAVTNAKIGASAVGTTEIANNAVTHAKLQDISSGRVLGNVSGSSNPPSAIDIDTDLSTVAADDTTLASAKAIKAYVDTNSNLRNFKVSQTYATQTISASADTYYVLDNLLTTHTLQKTGSIFRITANIALGSGELDTNFAFKIQRNLNFAGWQDFGLPQVSGQVAAHFCHFSGTDNNNAIATVNGDVYITSYSYSVGNTLQFRVLVAPLSFSSDIYINRAQNDSDVRAISSLCSEEIFQ